MNRLKYKATENFTVVMITIKLNKEYSFIWHSKGNYPLATLAVYITACKVFSRREHNTDFGQFVFLNNLNFSDFSITELKGFADYDQSVDFFMECYNNPLFICKRDEKTIPSKRKS
jgi:hypothetical protein